ncbi:MAG: hypothetical protein ACJAUH_000141 [Saprospiraceae bacterium]|jgi:hypothetical protein
MNCQHCGSKLLKNAKFCHSCGEAVVLKMEACQACSTLNPFNSAFCIGCGEALRKGNKGSNYEYQEEKNEHRKEEIKADEKVKDKKEDKTTYVYKPIFEVNLSDELELEESIKTYFFQALRNVVNEISEEKKYAEYVQLFYDSGFNFYFSQREKQLIRDLQRIPYLYPNDIDYQVDILIDDTFETILNRFTASHTQELNEWQPPDVTRWELVSKEDLNVEKMIFGYLEIDPNDEKYFTNFLTMPVPKLKNAWKSFLFATQSELPLVISDQTVFGSCKEGYAITNKGIYWKAFFNNPSRFYFEELYDIRKEQDWINVNGQYFHVNQKMNYKLLRLLKKLRSVYGNPSLN